MRRRWSYGFFDIVHTRRSLSEDSDVFSHVILIVKIQRHLVSEDQGVCSDVISPVKIQRHITSEDIGVCSNGKL